MPADARSEILSAIRSANRGAADPHRAEIQYGQIPRTYTQRSAVSRDQTLALFTERLIDYDAHVVTCTPDQLPSAIQDALQQHNASRVLIPADLPRDILPTGLPATPDTNLSAVELDHFDAAVTLCTLAIAETGTLVLQGLAGQGRRATTLVPDVHVCILRPEDVVATVPEAFERLASTATRPLTFVSGPSATADIEMTRIKGVHGPRQLHILLVQGSV
jgi:L-lactate dehydrogenase complex protein LldG